MRRSPFARFKSPFRRRRSVVRRSPRPSLSLGPSVRRRSSLPRRSFVNSPRLSVGSLPRRHRSFSRVLYDDSFMPSRSPSYY